MILVDVKNSVIVLIRIMIVTKNVLSVLIIINAPPIYSQLGQYHHHHHQCNQHHITKLLQNISN
jgi:hypothetical protein